MKPSKEQLMQLRQQGLSNIEIADMLGKSINLINQYFSEYKIARRRTALPQSKIDEIVGMYREGKSRKEIAREVGCAISTVRDYILAAGLIKEPASKHEPEADLELPEIFIMAEPKKTEHAEYFNVNGRWLRDVTHEFISG